MPSRPFRSSSTNKPSFSSTAAETSDPITLNNDTYSVSGLLESGDSDPEHFVKHPLSEELFSDAESTPFLNSNHEKSSYPKWTRRWRLLGLRKSFTQHKKSERGRRGSNGQYSLRRRPTIFRSIIYLLGATLMLLGVIQFLSLILGGFVAFFPDELDWVLDNWGEVGQPTEGLSHWPTDFTGDIRPVACHSHNDYWRKIPLYSAIHAGCIGVEADVWLFDEELYVGHSLSSLTSNRTLNNLYINPLLDILDKQNPETPFHPSPNNPPNGVFDTSPGQTLILLIDYKTSGPLLHPMVSAQLEPLRQRGYLTYFNGTGVVEGPLTIVATGNAPFDLLSANEVYRDIFFDAPLDQMAGGGADGSISPNPFSDPMGSAREEIPANPYSPFIEVEATATQLPSAPSSMPAASSGDQGQGHSGGAPLDPAVYSPQNSYYASVSFSKSIGFPWRSRLSAKQLELIRKQIRGAHAQGLKVRYWNLPAWPRGLRNHIWHVLVREGVDVLNVDDLVGATRRDWRKGKGWWY